VVLIIIGALTLDFKFFSTCWERSYK